MEMSATAAVKRQKVSNKQTPAWGTQMFEQMVENSPLNVMCVDRDLKLTYINPASKRTVKTIEHLLPVKVDQMLGQSIDIFHKDPARVRALLSSPANLPHRARITLGSEILE